MSTQVSPLERIRADIDDMFASDRDLGEVLEALARSLDKAHPGAAGSLREGLAETFTIGRLGVGPTLARTLRSTNAIESMIEICRDHSTNVKRWRDGQMALRWCAAGMHISPSGRALASSVATGPAGMACPAIFASPGQALSLPSSGWKAGPCRAKRGSRLRSAPLRASVIEPKRRSPSVNSHSMPEMRGEPSARSVAIVLWRPASNSRRTRPAKSGFACSITFHAGTAGQRTRVFSEHFQRSRRPGSGLRFGRPGVRRHDEDDVGRAGGRRRDSCSNHRCQKGVLIENPNEVAA